MWSVNVSDASMVISKALKELVKNTPKAADRVIKSACLDVESQAKRLVPKRDANLSRSITHELDPSRHMGFVGTAEPYALAQEFGSGLFSENPGESKSKGQKYEIKPKNPNGFLAFPIVAANRIKGGASLYRTTKGKLSPIASRSANVVVTKSVMHPGVHPHPYLRPAFTFGVGKLKGYIEKELGKAISDSK